MTQPVTMQETPTASPLVSVVIASFNMGRYLPLAVDSVLAQDYPSLEVIVVDDGSTDDTAEVMQAYDDEVKVNYIRQPNQGQPKAKNRGVKAAKGEFIAFCDADDLWAKNKLSLQIPVLLEHTELAVVASSVISIDKEGVVIREERKEGFQGKILKKLLTENPIPFGTAVIRRTCLEKVGYFDESLPMGIDWDLWLRLAVDHEFLKLEEPTYLYRHWGGQMSCNYEGRYDCAERILTKLFSANPSRFSFFERTQAYADVSVNRAYHRMYYAGFSLNVLLPLVRGLVSAPWSMKLWRLSFRTLLRRF